MPGWVVRALDGDMGLGRQIGTWAVRPNSTSDLYLGACENLNSRFGLRFGYIGQRIQLQFNIAGFNWGDFEIPILTQCQNGC